jgi:hypothetical protein
MQSVLMCEPRSKPSAPSIFVRRLPAMLSLIETEWKRNAWAACSSRPEHDLLRTAHQALGRLLELSEDDQSR